MVTAEGGEYVQSLDRGLAVIRCFNEHRQRLTIADIARDTGLTRATARRFLHTLEHLGYVGSTDGRFFLRPLVLQLGYAYLSSVGFPEVAQQHLLLLAEKLHESCSASVLDGDEIVYVARAQTNRIMTIALAVGTRLPAHVTSMGRVLIAAMPAADREKYVDGLALRGLTDHTITTKRKLRTALNQVAARGYCLIDQELEVGVRSVAAPVHDATGTVVAAINASGHASRVSMQRMQEEFLPRVLQAATDIDADLALRR